MIKENKVTKYLLYAIGEIALVIIGILIALQLNIAQQNRQDNNRLKTYLALLIEDIEKDKERIKECIYNDSIKAYHTKQFVIINKPLIDRKTLNYSFRTSSLVIHNSTYNAMNSSNILELIKNIETQKSISEYYSNIENSKRFEDLHLNTMYANYIEEMVKRKALVEFVQTANEDDIFKLNEEQFNTLYGYFVHLRDISNNEVRRYKKSLNEVDDLIFLIKKEINKADD